MFARSNVAGFVTIQAQAAAAEAPKSTGHGSPKKHASKGKHGESQTSRAAGAVQGAIQAASKAEAKLKEKWGKLAAEVVDVLQTTGKTMDAAETARKEEFLKVAVACRNPKATVDDTGTTADHRALLEAFDSRFRKARGEPKGSQYTRKVKSNFKGILVAVQIGEAKVTWNKPQADGTVKEVTETVNVVEWMKAYAKTIDRMATMATIVRKAAGYSNATGGGNTIKAINSTSLSNLIDTRLKGRLDVQGYTSMLEFLRVETSNLGGMTATLRGEIKAKITDLYDFVKEAVSKPKTNADHGKGSADNVATFKPRKTGTK